MQQNQQIRDWREIARQLMIEKDPEKIIQLSQELTVALDRANPNSVYEVNRQLPLKAASKLPEAGRRLA